MLRRWTKGLYLAIAITSRASAVRLALLSTWARANADALLPLMAVVVTLGGLVACSYGSPTGLGR